MRLHGRVGCLLEVGTGFHPELTGRENVYLNGAILGMSRAEIVRKFDEIVAFAEVERFIDTPVKHYSSGMYMRLAFAVAAHLEPEILMIDEVLAVGDAEFQKKCLGKMGTWPDGRTVLFVSHNMAAVQNLCSSPRPTLVPLAAGAAALRQPAPCPNPSRAELANPFMMLPSMARAAIATMMVTINTRSAETYFKSLITVGTLASPHFYSDRLQRNASRLLLLLCALRTEPLFALSLP